MSILQASSILKIARKARIGIPEFIALLLLTLLALKIGNMIHHFNYVDPRSYSNRSFARPAANCSFVIITYLAYRLNSFPLWIRILAWWPAFFFVYLAIGAALIVLNLAFKFCA